MTSFDSDTISSSTALAMVFVVNLSRIVLMFVFGSYFNKVASSLYAASSGFDVAVCSLNSNLDTSFVASVVVVVRDGRSEERWVVVPSSLNALLLSLVAVESLIGKPFAFETELEATSLFLASPMLDIWRPWSLGSLASLFELNFADDGMIGATTSPGRALEKNMQKFYQMPK